jgi:hypothetical protein
MSETQPADLVERLVRSRELHRLIRLALLIPQLVMGAIFAGVAAYAIAVHGWPALEDWLDGGFTNDQSAAVLFGFLAIAAAFFLLGAAMLVSGLRTLVRTIVGTNGEPGLEPRLSPQQIAESRGRVLGIPRLARRFPLGAPVHAPDGSVEMRSRPLHLTLGLFLAGFGLFWNAVILIAARDLLGAGTVGWIFAIFLVPFFLVGAGLLAGAIYFLSALRHPELTVRVKLDRERRTLAGTWSFSRLPSKLESLRIALRVTERLIEGRGDDATTKSVPVLEQTLVEGASLRASDRGEFSYRWPEGLELPHDAEHRRVDWVLSFTASSTGFAAFRMWVPVAVEG